MLQIKDLHDQQVDKREASQKSIWRLGAGSEVGGEEEVQSMSMLKGSGERAFEILLLQHPRNMANTCGEMRGLHEQGESEPPWLGRAQESNKTQEMRRLSTVAKHPCFWLLKGFPDDSHVPKGSSYNALLWDMCQPYGTLDILTKIPASCLVWKIKLFPSFQDCHLYIKDSCCAKKNIKVDIEGP